MSLEVRRRFRRALAWAARIGAAVALAGGMGRAQAAALPKADTVVAADGTGDFTTVQAALDAVPKGNRERRVIFVRNGIYNEHLRLERSFVTLRGEDRARTRLVFAVHDPRFDPEGAAVRRGLATLNLVDASDIVIEDLTVENPSERGGKPFAVFSRGTGTRIVIQRADILGRGGDTLSLWTRGLYYHRDLYVTGTYHFVGPRGTCYLADSVLEVVGPVSNALFNEGMEDERQKFVLQRCRLVSRVSFGLGSHFRDAAWYFIDCEFPETLRPEGKIFVAQSNPARPQPASVMFKWATDRVYFSGAKGPAYPWLRDNLERSEAKTAAAIDAAWTFGGAWDPERTTGPELVRAARGEGAVRLVFAEAVTVKGGPRLRLADGSFAAYRSGSGTAELEFAAAGPAAPVALELTGGAIVASQAGARLRAVADGMPLVPVPPGAAAAVER